MLPNMRNSSSRRRRMSGGADESLVQGKNFAANMPGQMRQSGGGNVYHGAPVLAGDAMLLDGDLRGKALMGPLDASTAAIRGMQDGGRRRGRGSRRNNAPMRRNRGRNNTSARRSRRGRNNASMRRGRNNASARRSRNNASMRRGRNNASARRGRNNASARRNRRRRNQMGGDGEEDYIPEEDAMIPVQRRNGNSRNMYGGAHSLLPTDYASVNQSPSLISGSAAARAGTAFTSDPFANGSGSA